MTLQLAPRLAALLLATAPLSLAAQEAPELPHAELELALDAHDPVSICLERPAQARPDIFIDHGRYRYFFSDQESRHLFERDPERWGIQWGGACGRMGPLSGRGASDRWLVHDGRIYLFASDGCRETFRKSPERFVAEPVSSPAASPGRVALGNKWFEHALRGHGVESLDALGALRLGIQGRTDGGWSFAKELVITAEGGLRWTTRWTPPTLEPPADPKTLDAEAEAQRATVFVVGAAGAGDFTIDGGTWCESTSAAQRAELLRLAHRQPLALLWARARFTAPPAFVREEIFGDVEAALVRVEVDGLTTTLYIDKESGRIVGSAWRGRAEDGELHELVERFTEWRTSSTVQLPAASVVTVDGEERPEMASAWSRLELLESAPPGTFAKRL